MRSSTPATGSGSALRARAVASICSRASAGVIASIGRRLASAITFRTCWICGCKLGMGITVSGSLRRRLLRFARNDSKKELSSRAAQRRSNLPGFARLDLEDAETAFRVMKHDPLDQPGQNLAGLARLRHRLRHPLMMARGS